MSGFSVTPLTVAGGTLGLCPLPRTDDDFAKLQIWRPDLVLTLVETDELALLAITNLPTEVQNSGTAWRHFPIADFDVPKGDGWPALSQELRALLARGGRIVIHCRGGCGRTGMIALRLMLEAGEAPDAALQRLMAAHPCAIETDAQLAWAQQL